MPKGTIHRETGILRRMPMGYALETDGGGKWMLDIKGSARKLIGKRVTVEGKRMGFDLIYVNRVWHEGKPWRLSIWKKLELWLLPPIILLGIILSLV
ncbi:MAG: DUF5818 domain-containing protein [Parasphingorhabdus sp.]|uniref:DUF5818 domain-containing protein n=1 Tax=Parasphingorhabdus sp. TaxID=2709688 RepID=UPI0032980F8D